MKHILIKSFLVSVFLSSTILTASASYEVSPFVVSFSLYPGMSSSSKMVIKKTPSKDLPIEETLYFSIATHDKTFANGVTHYNKKYHSLDEMKNLITLDKDKVTIKDDQTVTVPYTVSLTKENAKYYAFSIVVTNRPDPKVTTDAGLRTFEVTVSVPGVGGGGGKVFFDCLKFTQDIKLNTKDQKDSNTIWKLQQFLISRGFIAEKNNFVFAELPTGTFDQNTVNNIKFFQEMIGIEKTGLLDENTRTEITRLTCPNEKNLPTKNSAEVIPLGDNDFIGDESTFPASIGSYVLKSSSLSLNKQECTENYCIFNSRANYETVRAIWKVTIMQISKKAGKSMKDIEALTKLVQEKPLSTDGQFKNCSILGQSLICASKDSSKFVNIENSKYFLENEEYLNDYKRTKNETILFERQKKYISDNSEFIKYFLGKVFAATSSVTSTKLKNDQSSCITLTKALSKGQENTEVLTLQQFLVDGGYMTVKPDGYFRTSTVTAVKKFQIANGLSPVGSVGSGTRGKVKEVSCKRKITTTASSTADGAVTPSEAIVVVGGSMISATEQTLLKTRNSKRIAEVAALTLAVAQYMESNDGKVPASITSTPKETCISRELSCAGMIEPWLAPMYIPYMPVEPGSTKKNGSGYLFSKKGGTVTVASQYAEGGVVIKRDYFSDSGVVNYGTTTATELPKIPDEKTSSETIAGNDGNANGVRDDIELLLSQKAKSPNDLPYLLSYAKEYQKEITSPTPKSRSEALKIISKVSCTEKQNLKNGMDSKAMEAFDIYVQSQYINTPERKKAWSDFYNVAVSFTGDEINKIPCDNS